MTAAASPQRAARRRGPDWTARVRPLVQAAFVLFVLVVAVLHHTAVNAPSLHALCPFGAVESLWSLIVGGRFLPKLHPSTAVLAVGLFVGSLAVGGAFCGWACPLGAVQDGTDWLRGTLRWREVRVPRGLDAALRYGRFVVLAGIMYATVTTAKLWFADYDPYHVLFSLGFIFEPNLATAWPGYLITLAIVVGSLFIPRLWCRYLCPLGGLLSLVQRLSPIKVRRNAGPCIDCQRCDRVCPVRLTVSTRPAVTHDCTMCLRCTAVCPAPGALETALPGYDKRDLQAARSSEVAR